MTDEEKKAVGIVHGLLVTTFNYSGYTENGVFWQHQVDFKKDNPYYANAIEKVLNLIEKQQKENENLKTSKIFINSMRNGKELFQNTLKKYNDLSEKEIKLQSITGLTIDNLIDLFAKGYALQENKENLNDTYKAIYMQKDFDILTEENLKRLEEHCKKAIHYERGNIRKEHEITLALLYKYQESIPKEAIEKKIEELESTKFGACVNPIDVLGEMLGE